jgi:hypothetical protein
MGISVLLIIVAVVGAVAFVVMRERGPVGATFPRRHPMASMASEHARATNPAAVVVATQRLRAQARELAAGLQGGGFAQPAPYGAPAPIGDEDMIVISGSPLAEDPRALEARWRAARDADPMDDPRYADPRYDGRLAGDWLGFGREGRAR